MTVVLGAAAVAGTAFGIYKSNEADAAREHAAERAAEAEAAWRHAADRAAESAREAQRADAADARSRKLAKDLALEANKQIARVFRHEAPALRFEGCRAASTNGIEICVDVPWLLMGIVDAAAAKGAVWQRVVGVLAHEWYHFLDTQRGKRSSHEEELCADAFAGKTLARLDVPPHHFAELLRTFPQSSSHPPGAERAKAALRGHLNQLLG